jgi:hypothetical protein
MLGEEGCCGLPCGKEVDPDEAVLGTVHKLEAHGCADLLRGRRQPLAVSTGTTVSAVPCSRSVDGAAGCTCVTGEPARARSLASAVNVGLAARRRSHTGRQD